MYKDLLCQTPLLYLPIAAMLIFMAVFVAVLIRTMSRRASAYSENAALPLCEETPHE
jgi:hypothetical protein